jgi:hypothetical protein
MSAHRLAPALAFILLACRGGAPEVSSSSTHASEGGARAAAVHVIVFADHRSLVKLAVGDLLELPHEDAYEWHIKLEHEGYLEPAPPSDAGVARYRAAQPGTVRTLVKGEPKICLHSDAGCTIAKNSWAVTVQVE